MRGLRMGDCVRRIIARLTHEAHRASPSAQRQNQHGTSRTRRATRARSGQHTQQGISYTVRIIVWMRRVIGDPLHALVEVVEDPHERSIVSVERHRRHVLGDASPHDVNKGGRCAGRSGRWSIEFVGRRWPTWSRRRASHVWRRNNALTHISQRIAGLDGRRSKAIDGSRHCQGSCWRRCNIFSHLSRSR